MDDGTEAPRSTLTLVTAAGEGYTARPLMQEEAFAMLENTFDDRFFMAQLTTKMFAFLTVNQSPHNRIVGQIARHYGVVESTIADFRGDIVIAGRANIYERTVAPLDEILIGRLIDQIVDLGGALPFESAADGMFSGVPGSRRS